MKYVMYNKTSQTSSVKFWPSFGVCSLLAALTFDVTKLRHITFARFISLPDERL